MSTITQEQGSVQLDGAGTKIVSIRLEESVPPEMSDPGDIGVTGSTGAGLMCIGVVADGISPVEVILVSNRKLTKVAASSTRSMFSATIDETGKNFVIVSLNQLIDKNWSITADINNTPPGLTFTRGTGGNDGDV